MMQRRPFLTTAVKDEPASSAPYWAVATPVQPRPLWPRRGASTGGGMTPVAGESDTRVARQRWLVQVGARHLAQTT
jgi:hypothetical protein